MENKKELFHQQRQGTMMQNADWWYLVYENGKLFVHHEWSHTPLKADRNTDHGTEDLDIGNFLLTTQGKPEQKEFVKAIGPFLKTLTLNNPNKITIDTNRAG